MNLPPYGKDLNIREVTTGEIIHWRSPPTPTQASINLPNQNHTFNIMPLWEVNLFTSDGIYGVDLPWHASCKRQKLQV